METFLICINCPRDLIAKFKEVSYYRNKLNNSFTQDIIGYLENKNIKIEYIQTNKPTEYKTGKGYLLLR